MSAAPVAAALAPIVAGVGSGDPAGSSTGWLRGVTWAVSGWIAGTGVATRPPPERDTGGSAGAPTSSPVDGDTTDGVEAAETSGECSTGVRIGETT